MRLGATVYLVELVDKVDEIDNALPRLRRARPQQSNHPENRLHGKAHEAALEDVAGQNAVDAPHRGNDSSAVIQKFVDYRSILLTKREVVTEHQRVESVEDLGINIFWSALTDVFRI